MKWYLLGSLRCSFFLFLRAMELELGDNFFTWFMIAFIICKSNLVPLLEGLSSSNPFRFWVLGFVSFCRIVSVSVVCTGVWVVWLQAHTGSWRSQDALCSLFTHTRTFSHARALSLSFPLARACTRTRTLALAHARALWHQHVQGLGSYNFRCKRVADVDKTLCYFDSSVTLTAGLTLGTPSLIKATRSFFDKIQGETLVWVGNEW